MPTDAMAKVRELIVYLASRSAEDDHFGRTKLAKLLFFCDFGAVEELGAPITGARYRKKERGPLAEEELLALRDLRDSGSIDIEQVNVYGRTQKHIIARREADISWLTPAQHVLIDEVVARHWDDDAKRLSDLSHEFPGWEVADMDDVIPYHAVFIARQAPTQADIDWAEGVARELELV